jgi:hypothetical protein
LGQVLEFRIPVQADFTRVNLGDHAGTAFGNALLMELQRFPDCLGAFGKEVSPL